MVTGVACGLQNRYGAFTRPGWVRFPHVPATSLRIAVLVLLGSAAWGPSAVAQDPEPPESVVVIEADSIAARSDTVPPISALGAFTRSFVLPGWGQVEVGRPERGAIYFGAEAASLVMVFKSSAKLGAAQRTEPRDDDLIDSRKGQRENWIVLSVFIAFLSGIDAWVSTHFWDFEATLQPPVEGAAAASFGVRLNVP